MTFARYIAIQVLAYAIDMGVFMALVHSTQTRTLLANVIGKVAAGACAFFAHRHFTFETGQDASRRRQLVLYVSLLAVNIPLTGAALWTALFWIHPTELAKFLSDATCLLLTYWLSKSVIFSGRHVLPATKAARDRASR